MDELVRSRRRWRAIALVLAVGHVVVLVAAYFLFERLRIAESQIPRVVFSQPWAK